MDCETPRQDRLARLNGLGDEIECGLSNASVRFSDGSMMSYRFIDNYDPDLRVNQRLTIDGAAGSIVGTDLRFLLNAGPGDDFAEIGQGFDPASVANGSSGSDTLFTGATFVVRSFETILSP